MIISVTKALFAGLFAFAFSFASDTPVIFLLIINIYWTAFSHYERERICEKSRLETGEK